MQDAFDRRLRLSVLAVDRQVGEGVDRVPPFHEAFEYVPWIALTKQGAIVAARCAPDQNVQICLQPDGYCARADGATGRRGHVGAAAGGEYVGLLRCEQPLDHPPLAMPEGSFAMSLNAVGAGASGGRLDLVVRVEKAPTEARRETAADAGFAGAHEAHEDEMTLSWFGWIRLFVIHGINNQLR